MSAINLYLRWKISAWNTNSCPTFVAFLEPEIQSAIDSLLPPPAYQHKALGTNELLSGFPGYVSSRHLV